MKQPVLDEIAEERVETSTRKHPSIHGFEARWVRAQAQIEEDRLAERRRLKELGFDEP